MLAFFGRVRGRGMLPVLRALWRKFVGMPTAVKAVVAAVAFLLGLIALALSVALSPLIAFLLLIAFLVCVAAFLFRLLRRRPVLWWGMAGGACFVLMLGFSGIAVALYGGAVAGRDDPPREEAESEPGGGTTRTAQREETTEEAAPPETTAVTETNGVIEASAEPPSPCGGWPEEILARQYRLINGGEYGAAYALFADESKALVPPQEYGAFFEANAPYSITDYSFPSVDIRGEEATVGVSFTLSDDEGSQEISVTQRLTCEDRAWRVVMRDEQATAFLAPQEEDEHTQDEPAPEPEPSDPEPAEPQYEPDPSPLPDAPGGEDRDCADFSSQAEAQEAYEDDFSDPNGLDADSDGEACEESFGGDEPLPEETQYEGPQYEEPDASSGYPPFPVDPFDGPTCEEVGGGPYSVPEGSPRDSDGDGVACE